MSLTKEEVANYFFSKFKRPTCPFCQERDWEIATFPSKELAFFQPLEASSEEGLSVIDLGNLDKVDPDSPSASAIPSLVAVRCGNCGWVAYFDTQKIIKDKNHVRS